MSEKTFNISKAIQAILQVSSREMVCHAQALECLRKLHAKTALIWLPRAWVRAPEQSYLWNHLLSGRSRRRLRALLRHSADRGITRAYDAATERFALIAAVWQLLGAYRQKFSFTPTELSLSHTSLGRPIVKWHTSPAAWADIHGLQSRYFHISFSHDGNMHLTLLAYAPGLCGLGIDVVHLPRLRQHGKDSAYLHRLARHFMCAEEYSAFMHHSQHDNQEMLLRRVAAHFSLMESASKALGTGLRMGCGMGQPSSLPKRALGVMQTLPSVSFLLGPEAQKRCRQLGAGKLEGHWSAEQEYLVSVAFLWQ
jgi:phosphopantetheinyl transferase (holo-ACP synthase)